MRKWVESEPRGPSAESKILSLWLTFGKKYALKRKLGPTKEILLEPEILYTACFHPDSKPDPPRITKTLLPLEPQP